MGSSGALAALRTINVMVVSRGQDPAKWGTLRPTPARSMAADVFEPWKPLGLGEVFRQRAYLASSAGSSSRVSFCGFATA
jgi:hypothetical protein